MHAFYRRNCEFSFGPLSDYCPTPTKLNLNFCVEAPQFTQSDHAYLCTGAHEYMHVLIGRPMAINYLIIICLAHVFLNWKPESSDILFPLVYRRLNGPCLSPNMDPDQ